MATTQDLAKLNQLVNESNGGAIQHPEEMPIGWSVEPIQGQDINEFSSGYKVAVFKNTNTNEAVVVHGGRDTFDYQDWMTQGTQMLGMWKDSQLPDAVNFYDSNIIPLKSLGFNISHTGTDIGGATAQYFGVFSADVHTFADTVVTFNPVGITTSLNNHWRSLLFDGNENFITYDNITNYIDVTNGTSLLVRPVGSNIFVEGSDLAQANQFAGIFIPAFDQAIKFSKFVTNTLISIVDPESGLNVFIDGANNTNNLGFTYEGATLVLWPMLDMMLKNSDDVSAIGQAISDFIGNTDWQSITSTSLGIGAAEAADGSNSIVIFNGENDLNSIINHIMGSDYTSSELYTNDQEIQITTDENNTTDLTASTTISPEQAGDIINEVIPNLAKLNLNDPVNQFIVDRSGNDINVNVPTDDYAKTLIKRTFEDGPISREISSNGGLLRIQVTANDTYHEVSKNGDQIEINTNSTDMEALGELLQEGTLLTGHVVINSNGQTITGQQQNGETVVTSNDLNVDQQEAIQVGFLNSVASNSLNIAANIFDMILDPVKGLWNVANDILSQIVNFFGNLFNAIGAFYESSTLVDSSTSVADQTGEVFLNDQAVSKTEFLNLDEDGNGIINADDSNYENLKIWQDVDEDGVADAGEIKTLSEAGIISLDTDDADLYTAGNNSYLSEAIDHSWYINQSYTYRVGNYAWIYGPNETKILDNGNTLVGTNLDNVKIYGGLPDPELSLSSGIHHEYNGTVVDTVYPIKYICGDGDDLAEGNYNNNLMYGGEGSDTIHGNTGNDLIYGESAGDNLLGQVGNDTIYGGSGDDLIVGMHPDAYTSMATGEVTYPSQILQPGETDDDKLYGGTGNDTILGRAGDDYIDGGAGADQMEGGSGDDIYIVNSINDNILEQPDEGYDKVYSAVNYLIGSDVEELKLIGNESIHGSGNKLDNLVTGNSGDNIIDGVTGADTMVGQAGNDTYYVDDINDQIIEKDGEGIDTAQASITYELNDNVENLNLLSFSTSEKGIIDGESVLVYGYPKRYELDYMQGSNPEYLGTCALTSIANLFVQSENHEDKTEEDVVNYAIQNDLCVTEAESDSPLRRGGSSMQEQISILEGFGLPTRTLLGYDPEKIAEKIKDGYGVILGVNAGKLWNDQAAVVDGAVNHIITISGIVYNTDNTEVIGFYICDSGRRKVSDMTRFLSMSQFEECVNVEKAYALITEDPIKLWEPDINAIGNALDNKLVGNEGSNILDGKEGADVLVGKKGNDRYIIDNPDDIAVEAEGEGVDTIESSITFTTSANVENLELSGTSDIDASGNSLNNELTGNSANNKLEGLAGSDIIEGGEGNDTIIGGINDDFLKDLSGDDEYRINSGDGKDVLIDFSGTDRVVFASDINETDLEYEINSYDLVIKNTATLDTLTVSNWFRNDSNKIEEFYFEGSGTSLNIEQVHNKINQVSSAEFLERVSITLLYDSGLTESELINLDSFLDGLIDSNDNDFSNLQVWQDADEDGIGDIGEIKTLDEAAIDYIRTENADIYTAGNADYLNSSEIDQLSIDNIIQGIDFTVPVFTQVEKLVKSTDLYGDVTPTGRIDLTSIHATEGNDSANFGGSSAHLFIEGQGGDDVFSGGDGNDVFYGQDGKDNLFGIGGSDYLDGGAGNDLLAALQGNNYLDGGLGNDTLDGSTGNDSLFGGTGNDWLNSTASFTLLGTLYNNIGSGNDYIDGEEGEDVAFGQEGEDTIWGGINNDTLQGNEGNDFVNGEEGNDVLCGQVDDDTLIGGAGNDHIRGFTHTGEVKQTLEIGETDNDIILGEAGEDTILAQVGNDQAYGGIDNDSIYGGAGDDSLFGGDGNDLIKGFTASYETQQILEVGETDNDTILGEAGDDELLGQFGDDLILGGIDKDSIYGGDGNDSLYGESGNDSIFGETGNDVLSGGDGDDIIGGLRIGDEGNQTLEPGETDNDTIFGGSGRDTISGHLGDDLILGGLDEDEVQGNEGNDSLYGEDGQDTIYGQVGDDLIYGGEDNDTLIGFTSDSDLKQTLDSEETDNDKLFGGLGNDSLVGKLGNDYLDGGSGNDTMEGGVGDDIYVVNSFNDSIVENHNEGTDKVFSNITYKLDQNIEELKLIGSENLDAEGNELDNKISGNRGNNVLNGLAGADIMTGQEGDDVYYVDNDLDQVNEKENEGIDTVKSNRTRTLSNYVENIELLDGANINATGNSLNNRLTGNTGNNLLSGQSGDDTYFFTGEWGEDTVIDSSGSDKIIFGNDVSVNDIKASINNDDLVISKVGSPNKITLSNWFISPDNKIETIELADGTISSSELETMAINFAPTATDVSVILDEDKSIEIDVLAGATDPDGDSLFIESYTDGSNGRVALGTDNKLVYIPNENFNGTDSFEYTISDGNGGSITKTANITVNSVNDAPAASDINTTTDEDTVLDINLGSNDVDGDILTLNIDTQPINGTLEIIDNDNVRYTPDANYNGTDSFDYTISDGNGGSITKTAGITVNPVNDDPTATSLTASVDEDSSVTFNAITDGTTDFVTDIDNDTLTIDPNPSANNGSVSVNGQELTYTPNADFNGNDTITYSISDGNGGTVPNTVNVTVNPVDEIRIDGTSGDDSGINALQGNSLDNEIYGLDGNDELYGYEGNDTLDGGTGNDSIYGDSGNDTILETTGLDYIYSGDGADRIIIGDEAQTAKLVSGSKYIEAGNGNDYIFGNTSQAKSTIKGGLGDDTIKTLYGHNVMEGNEGNDTLLIQDSDYNTYIFNKGDGNDTITDSAYHSCINRNDKISFGSDISESNLSYEQVENDLIITINYGDATPADSIIIKNHFDSSNVYRIEKLFFTQDSIEKSLVGLTIDDLNPAPVNSPPIASLSTYTMDEDDSVLIDVLNGVTDPDGDNSAISLVEVKDEQNGTSIIENGQVRFIPNINYNGTAYFTYVLEDEGGARTEQVVEVTVNPVNDAPTATSLTASVDEDSSVTFNAITDGTTDFVTDIDNDTLTIDPNPSANNGSVSVNGQELTYTPNTDFNGNDTITYSISDGNGGTVTNTVSITVNPVNDAPTATIDSAAGSEDNIITLDVLAYSSDIDGDSLVIDSFTQPTNGAVANVDNKLVYTPNADFNGADSFDYTISDGNGGVVSKTVSLTIDAVNDNPIANPLSAAGDEDTTIIIDGLSGASDIDGDTLTIDAGATANNGSVTVDGSNLIYTPNTDFNGTDTITYSISDGNGGNISNIVNVTVNPVDEPVNEITGTSSSENLSGTNEIDSIQGLGGNDSIYGYEGDDILDGGSGHDTIDGGLGADTMIGGTGNDIYYVDDPGDVIIDAWGAGTETVKSTISFSIDSISDNALNHIELLGSTNIDAYGNLGDNKVTGNSGNNYLEGKAGKDTLDGKSGADTMVGGSGNDVYYVENAGDIVNENAGEGIDTVNSYIDYTLGANVENLTLNGSSLYIHGTGNDLDNLIIGTGFNNELTGEAGNDTLDGGPTGADTLIGGTGDDVYYINSTGDVVTENLDEGTDTVNSSITYTLGNNVENLTLNGSSLYIHGTGNDLDNLIIGTGFNNELTGGAGNDTLDGGPTGADTLIGGTGDDYLTGGTGNDYLEDENGSEKYYFTSGDGQDTISDSGGNNYDYVVFEPGILESDISYVRHGNDLDLILENTNSGDSITVRNHFNTDNRIERFLFNETGDIKYYHNIVVDRQGTTGNDNLQGLSNREEFYGFEGNDTIISSAGDDTITGGTGNDYLEDENGSEKYRFALGDGQDTILDRGASFYDYVVFENDILESHIQYFKSGDDLVIKNTNSPDDLITVQNHFITENRIERFYFEATGATRYHDGISVTELLTANDGNENLNGGEGNDIYIFNLGDDIDTITDSAGTDQILFEADISKTNIALFRDASDNLVIDYGTIAGSDKITVTDQDLVATTIEVEKLELSTGEYLNESDINQVIQDITTYAANNSISLTSVEDVKNNAELMNIVSAAWHV